MQALYEAKDLRNQFRELEGLNDSTLVPLMERAAHRFMDSLKNNPSRYGVSDIKSLSGDVNYLVVDGKIVLLYVDGTDIDVVSGDDGCWWMLDRLIFEGDEERVNKLVEHVRKFIGEQSLDELVAEAAATLKTGKAHHLGMQTRDFYLAQKPENYAEEIQQAIRKQDGFTIAEAVVTMDYGFGTARGMVKFAEECKKYEKNIYFKRADETPDAGFKFNREEYANGKSVLELMTVCSSEPGTRIQVVVEGEDEAAKQMAVRLYSALTSKDSTAPDFCRLKE